MARSRSLMYWPLPPLTCGIFSTAASSCDASVSARTPSLPRIGVTTPSFWAISARSRCSGSIAWWPRSLASDWAACSASCALTVSLSSLILFTFAVGAPSQGSGARRSGNHCAPSVRICRRSPCAGLRGSTVGESLRAVLSLRIAARGIAPKRPQTLVQLLFGGRQLGRHHDPHGHQLVAGAAAFEPRHAVARQAERAAARRRRRNLHGDLAPQRRHLDRRAQRRLGRGERQREMQVVALALELRIRRDGDDQIEVAAAAGPAAAFAGHPHLLARAHAGRDAHVDVAARALPARAVTRRTRLAANVAAAVAGGAGLVQLERERLARAVERLVQRDLDARLDVLAAPPTPGPRAAAAEEGFAAAAPESNPTAAGLAGARPARSEVAEDRAEEVGEVSGVPVLDRETARLLTRGLLRIALPVGTEGVVATALLGVGQDLVRLVDLLEACVLTFVDVGMVLTGELPVRGLDGLVVRLSVDAQDLIVILEFDGHSSESYRKCSRSIEPMPLKQLHIERGPVGPLSAPAGSATARGGEGNVERHLPTLEQDREPVALLDVLGEPLVVGERAHLLTIDLPDHVAPLHPRSAGASTFLPSNSSRMSPGLRPALAAGLSGMTSEMSTPLVSLALNERASSCVRGWIETPSQPRVTRPLLLISV